MPIENLGKKHLTKQQAQQIYDALQTILTILKEVSPNFTEEDFL
jgi:hypothetical protein